MNILNPNQIKQAQTPSGHAGLNAGFTLPFYTYGYWYADGLQQTYTSSEISQKASSPFFGRTRANTFKKDAADCPNAFAVV